MPGSLSDIVNLVNKDAFEQIPESDYHVFRHSFFHRVNYDGLAVSIPLFNTGGNSVLTNLPQGSLFPQDYIFRLQTVRLIVERGVGITGAANNNTVSHGASSINSLILPVSQSIEQALTSGSLSLRVGKRDLILPVPGLWRFPAGQGQDGFAHSSVTTASINQGSVVTNNGAPVVANSFPMVPYTCLPGDAIVSALTWPVAVSTFQPFVIRAEMEGIAVQVQAR